MTPRSPRYVLCTVNIASKPIGSKVVYCIQHGDVNANRLLQEEVSAESKRVWRFIIEREIEAPDRFQAIQSYR
jgi:hypothetical protein